MKRLKKSVHITSFFFLFILQHIPVFERKFMSWLAQLPSEACCAEETPMQVIVSGFFVFVFLRLDSLIRKFCPSGWYSPKSFSMLVEHIALYFWEMMHHIAQYFVWILTVMIWQWCGGEHCCSTSGGFLVWRMAEGFLFWMPVPVSIFSVKGKLESPV